MTNQFSVSIQGPQASEALAELVAIEGIDDAEGPITSAPRRRGAGLPEAVSAVVGIAGGIASIVAQILTWREKWLKRGEAERFSVTIEDAAGNRLALDRATPEQIAAALHALPRSGVSGNAPLLAGDGSPLAL